MITVLVPSRGRPAAAWEVKDSFDATADLPGSGLIFVIDDDDPELASYQQERKGERLDLLVQPRVNGGGMVGALNLAARTALRWYPQPSVLGFIGDDHRFRTKGWDRYILEHLHNHPGFAYADDLAQRENLPTQVFITARIVEALGYMALPTLHHLYVDNSWKQLADQAGCLYYFPKVVIEHMHPAYGKGEWDEGHIRVNAQDVYSKDGQAYVAWCESPDFSRDVRTVEGVLEALT